MLRNPQGASRRARLPRRVKHSPRNDRMETIAASKGRIVIPSKIRRQLGIREKTRLQIDVDENKRIILTPITREYIHSLRGKYKGEGLMKAFLAEKKKETS